MDPRTALVTFMLQTEPSVQSVRLIGSWDNFSTSYAMERDARRDRGQWKGCYAFNNITCDDDRGVGPARDGGLKMGNTYHYFYELDGTHETHDPTRPSTRHCPYMPGQTVNTLFVPIQQTLRKRSASLSSMRNTDFMTMNPREKYTTPRPAPRAPLASLPGSAHILRHRTSSRSLSPSPSWRRFFRRSPERAPTPEVEVSAPEDDARSVRSYGSGSRSRDISPESLSRFLRDESPSPVEERPPVMVIPEEIEEEAEGDDDENFAQAGAEGMYPTGLAPPPPFRRAASSPTPPAPEKEARHAYEAESPILPDFECRSRFSFSSVSSCESEGGSPEVETPVVYGLAEERGDGYGLPGTASSKGVGSIVGVQEMGWMVDEIKS